MLLLEKVGNIGRYRPHVWTCSSTVHLPHALLAPPSMAWNCGRIYPLFDATMPSVESFVKIIIGTARSAGKISRFWLLANWAWSTKTEQTTGASPRAMLQACRSRASSALPICVSRSDPTTAVPRAHAIARLRTSLGDVMTIVGSEARARQVRRAHPGGGGGQQSDGP